MSKPHEMMNEYLDFYESLLTAKQQEIMKYYFRDDFSLSEIAENLSITRSAVSDNIQRTSKILENYENKLKLVEKYQQRSKLYVELDEIGNSVVKEISKRLKESELDNYE